MPPDPGAMGGSRFFDVAPASQTHHTAPPDPTVREPRLALLIGNARYRARPLRNPVRDVRRLDFILAQLGFEVSRVEDADKMGLERAIATLAERVASEPGAVVLVHFAGHGVQVGQQLYLVPVDADPAAPFDAQRATALEAIVAALAVPARALVIVVDACRVATAGGSDPPSSALATLSALPVSTASTLVVYSTALGATADDGRADVSPYIAALSERLPELLEPGRRVHEVFVAAAEALRAVPGVAQSPALFLQGVLPPLTLDAADARRREAGVRILPPRVPWLRIAAGIVVLLLAGAVVTGAVWWQRAWPEERRAVLARVGLATPADPDAGCAPPWDRTDRFGLTVADWCNLWPFEAARRHAVARRWDEMVVPAGAEGDPKALMLLATRRLMQEMPTPKDIAAALSHVRRARDQGLPMAAGAISFFRDEALAPLREATRDRQFAGFVDAQEATAGYIAALEAGYLPVMLTEARTLLETGRTARAVDLLGPASVRDETGTADTLLAAAFLGGYGGDAPLDPVAGMRHLRRASERGNQAALTYLLAAYRRGDIRLSTDEALKYSAWLHTKDEALLDLMSGPNARTPAETPPAASPKEPAPRLTDLAHPQAGAAGGSLAHRALPGGLSKPPR